MNQQVEEQLKRLRITPQGEEFCPLSEDALKQIENYAGAELPDDYREFLQEYGRARLDELAGVRPKEAIPGCVDEQGILAFGVFLGGPGKSSVMTACETFHEQERMPRSIIPFARDSMGNVFCIAIRNDSFVQRGKIYFWDGQNEPSTIEEYEERGESVPENRLYINLHLLSNSFSEFVLNLEKRELD